MRARNIKPSIFINEKLAFEDPLNFVIFTGLWCYADRAGRFENKIERIHLAVNPGRDISTTKAVLTWLQDNGFIRLYQIGGESYGDIPTFLKHQKPHKNEKESIIPAYCTNNDQGSALEQPRPQALGSDRGLMIDDRGLRKDDCYPAFENSFNNQLKTGLKSVWPLYVELCTAFGTNAGTEQGWVLEGCKAERDIDAIRQYLTQRIERKKNKKCRDRMPHGAAKFFELAVWTEVMPPLDDESSGIDWSKVDLK